MGKRIVAIVGSYRKGGMIDQAVGEILAACKECGAETATIYLIDEHVEFCTNCRSCMQVEGLNHGQCVLQDGMTDILAQIERADGLVIGAPVNFFNVNAVTRRFMERLGGCAYWPWGKAGPAFRVKGRRKPVVLVTSSAMPAILGRVATGAMRALKSIARAIGARPAGTLFIGMAALQQEPVLPPAAAAKARKLGHQLAG